MIADLHVNFYVYLYQSFNMNLVQEIVFLFYIGAPGVLEVDPGEEQCTRKPTEENMTLACRHDEAYT